MISSCVFLADQPPGFDHSIYVIALHHAYVSFCDILDMVNASYAGLEKSGARLLNGYAADVLAACITRPSAVMILTTYVCSIFLSFWGEFYPFWCWNQNILVRLGELHYVKNRDIIMFPYSYVKHEMLCHGSWWGHDMEMLSVSLALCEGNHWSWRAINANPWYFLCC